MANNLNASPTGNSLPGTAQNSPRIAPQLRIEDDKKFAQVLRRIFIDAKRLTEAAITICKELHINQEDLLDKSLEDFQIELRKKEKVPKEIIEMRYNHFQNKRRKHFESVCQAMGIVSHKPQKQPFGLQPIEGGSGIITSNRWRPFNLKQQQNSAHNMMTRGGIANLSHTQQLPNIGKQFQHGDKIHLNINFSNHHGNNDGDNESQRSFNPNSTSGQFVRKQVGKAAFSTQVHSPQMQHGMKVSFRSTLTSPENFGKVTHSLMNLQSKLHREQSKLDRLKQVRQNAMEQAEEELKRIHKKILREQKNTLKQQKRAEELMEEELARKEKVALKRTAVVTNLNHTLKEIAKRSQSGYSQNIKEAKEMTSQRRERDRQHSARHFEALKHKLDEEESMRRRGSEMRKKEDEVVMRGLDAYQEKVRRGASLAEHYKRETSSRASKVSIQHEEALNKYEKIMESGKKVTLEKVVSKGSIISAKLKKKNEYNHKQAEKVREKLDSRFEKNRSARSIVDDEHKKKGKMTMDRIKQKDKLKEILLEQQHLEHMKHKELNTIRRLDHVDALNKELALMTSYKEFIAKKAIRQELIAKDIKENMRMYQKQQTHSPYNTHHPMALTYEEQQIKKTLRPIQVIAKERLNLTLQMSGQISPRTLKRLKREEEREREMMN